MSTSTPYGYVKPTDGERGTWWGAIISNWIRMDAHTHNGVDSAPIPTTSLTKTTQLIDSANWVATSGGLYNQTVTLPAGFTFNAGLSVKFFVWDGANITDEVLMTPVRASNSTMTLETNDNTLSLKAVYA